MNEKIKELSTKAHRMVNEIYRNMEEEPEGDFDVWYHDMVEEKFAENVVAEFIQRLTDAEQIKDTLTTAMIATEMFEE